MKLFYFDCIAVLEDRWSIGLDEIPGSCTQSGQAIPAEPSLPEGEPIVLGFFLNVGDAEAFIDVTKAHHLAAESAQHQSSIFSQICRLQPRRRTYFLVPLHNLTLPPHAPLYSLEELLQQAALNTARGIGACPPISQQEMDGYALKAKLDRAWAASHS